MADNQAEINLSALPAVKQEMYGADLSGADFTRCGGNLGGNLESCAAFARIPGQPGRYAIRDADLGEASPTLCLTEGEIKSLMKMLSDDWAE